MQTGSSVLRSSQHFSKPNISVTHYQFPVSWSCRRFHLCGLLNHPVACPALSVRLTALSGRRRLFSEQPQAADCNSDDLPQDYPTSNSQAPKSEQHIRTPGQQAGATTEDVSASSPSAAEQILAQNNPKLRKQTRKPAKLPSSDVQSKSAQAAVAAVAAAAATAPGAGQVAGSKKLDPKVRSAKGLKAAAAKPGSASKPQLVVGGPVPEGNAAAAPGTVPVAGTAKSKPKVRGAKIPKAAAARGEQAPETLPTVVEPIQVKPPAASASSRSGSSSSIVSSSASKPGAAVAAVQIAPAAAESPVHVLWDLDNKYPETLDHKGLIDRMRKSLQPYGKVVEMRAFGNYNTLNFVPRVWAEAQLMDEGDFYEDEEEEIDMCCPICHRKFKDEGKLRKHFIQLHQREHTKRMAHKPAAKKYVKSDKFQRVKEGMKSVLYKKRGYNLEGILRKLGVKVEPVQMGPQKADVLLQKHAVKLMQKWKDGQESGIEGGSKKPGGGKKSGGKSGGGKSRSKGGGGAKDAGGGAGEVIVDGPVGTSSPDATTTAASVNAAPEAGTPTRPRPVVALVSDDQGFGALLKMFKSAGWTTINISNGQYRDSSAHVPWINVVDP